MDGDYDSGVGSIDSPGEPASPTECLRDVLGRSSGAAPPSLPRKTSVPSVAKYTNLEVGGRRERGGMAGSVDRQSECDPYATYSHLPPVSNVSICVKKSPVRVTETSSASGYVRRSPSRVAEASNGSSCVDIVPVDIPASNCFTRSPYHASSRITDYPGHGSTASNESNRVYRSHSLTSEGSYRSSRVSRSPGRVLASNSFSRSPNHVSRAATVSGGSSRVNGSPSHYPRVSNVSICVNQSPGHVPGESNALSSVNRSPNHSGFTNIYNSVLWSPPMSSRVSRASNRVSPASNRVSPASSHASSRASSVSSRVSRSSGRVSGLSSRTSSFSTFSSIPEESHAPLSPPSHTHPTSKPVAEGQHSNKPLLFTLDHLPLSSSLCIYILPTALLLVVYIRFFNPLPSIIT